MLARAQPHLPLATVLIAAMGLRLWGLSFGLPNDHCRPDEVFMVHKSLSIGAGDLNPHAFYYPTLHFYLFAAIFGAYFVGGYAVGALTDLQGFELSFFLDPSAFYLLGRSLSVLMGTASVWLVYLIGCMLGGRRAGHVSAMLLAVCFLHVRDSHFATPDIPATFYLLASCVLTVRYAQMGHGRDLYLGAALMGLAASTKYNAGLFAITVLVTSLRGTDPLRQKIHRLLIAVGLMALAFIAASPYIVLDFATFWRDLNEVRTMIEQGGIVDLGRGWSYYLRFTLPHSLGWPLFAIGLVGAVRWSLRRRLAEVALLAGLTGYYVIAGSGNVVYFRYTIPMIPFFCLAGGLLVNDIARSRIRVWLAALLIAAPTAWSSYAHSRLLAQPDTRLQAVQWIEEHVPPGAKVARCCDASLFGHPQVRLSAAAAERQKSELSQAGYTFRNWRYLQAIEDHTSRPGYDIVELRRGEHSGYSWIWSQYDIDRLRREQVKWIIVQEHPHLKYSNVDGPFATSLTEHAVKTFDPFLGTTTPLYDQIDAYYLPVAGFGGVNRPGPKITIYHLDSP